MSQNSFKHTTPKYVYRSVRFTPELWARLMEMSKRLRLSVTQITALCIERSIDDVEAELKKAHSPDN